MRKQGFSAFSAAMGLAFYTAEIAIKRVTEWQCRTGVLRKMDATIDYGHAVHRHHSRHALGFCYNTDSRTKHLCGGSRSGRHPA
jgi:hypothetical protein